MYYARRDSINYTVLSQQQLSLLSSCCRHYPPVTPRRRPRRRLRRCRRGGGDGGGGWGALGAAPVAAVVPYRGHGVVAALGVAAAQLRDNGTYSAAVAAALTGVGSVGWSLP